MNKKTSRRMQSAGSDVFVDCGICLAGASMGMLLAAIPAGLLADEYNHRWAGAMVLTAGILLGVKKALDGMAEYRALSKFPLAVGGVAVLVAEIVGAVLHSYMGIFLWGICALLLGSIVAFFLVADKEPQKPPLTPAQREEAAARARAERESKEREERIQRLALDYHERLDL